MFPPKNPDTLKLSKRTIMSFINGLFDPPGLTTPFIVRGKILMRKTWTTAPDIGWDDPIPEELNKEWILFFSEMISLSNIPLARCLRPKDCVGKSDLILFQMHPMKRMVHVVI